MFSKTLRLIAFALISAGFCLAEVHTVSYGDTMWSIARKNNVNLADLLKSNESFRSWTDERTGFLMVLIKPGDKVVVPTPKEIGATPTGKTSAKEIPVATSKKSPTPLKTAPDKSVQAKNPKPVEKQQQPGIRIVAKDTEPITPKSIAEMEKAGVRIIGPATERDVNKSGDSKKEEEELPEPKIFTLQGEDGKDFSYMEMPVAREVDESAGNPSAKESSLPRKTNQTKPGGYRYASYLAGGGTMFLGLGGLFFWRMGLWFPSGKRKSYSKRPLRQQLNPDRVAPEYTVEQKERILEDAKNSCVLLIRQNLSTRGTGEKDLYVEKLQETRLFGFFRADDITGMLPRPGKICLALGEEAFLVKVTDGVHSWMIPIARTPNSREWKRVGRILERRKYRGLKTWIMRPRT